MGVAVTDLADASAAELSALYRLGQASPEEAVRAVIDRIGRWEPTLCALYAYEPERALADARAGTARWLKGQPLSPLDGVPGTLKENIATRGTPMPVGSAATPLQPMAEDAPPAARWREAGCVLLAKTTMPDFGMLSSGLSSIHALARNPWDTRMNPGGSSAGAGAASAAGYGPLHVGTDIGGSIRLPAGWCGVFGFKPSLGRIPIKPPYAGRVAGPMTRTVRDAALLMAQLAQPDGRDTMSLPPAAIDWLALDDFSVNGLRLGLQLDPGWGLAVEPETRAAIEAAAKVFEAAGAHIEPVPAFSTRAMIDGMDRFWRMRSWLDISAMSPERQAKVLPYIRQWAEGAAGISAAELFDGYNQMGALREAAVAASRPFDFVLSPVSPVSSFPAEWAGPTNDPARPLEHINFTLPYNMSEQPAASVPCGFTAAGLPIGLQIAGQRHDDLGVLRLSRAFEQLRPAAMQRPWPRPQ
jgi:Asp-tRNA(Asn)/Glu-tRNA(Gln) amidotransferase A subunit family amidase